MQKSSSVYKTPMLIHQLSRFNAQENVHVHYTFQNTAINTDTMIDSKANVPTSLHTAHRAGELSFQLIFHFAFLPKVRQSLPESWLWVLAFENHPKSGSAISRQPTHSASLSIFYKSFAGKSSNSVIAGKHPGLILGSYSNYWKWLQIQSLVFIILSSNFEFYIQF